METLAKFDFFKDHTKDLIEIIRRNKILEDIIRYYNL